MKSGKRCDCCARPLDQLGNPGTTSRGTTCCGCMARFRGDAESAAFLKSEWAKLTVPIERHRSTNQRVSVLLNPREAPGHEIFRTFDGYVACLPNGVALSPTFAHSGEARCAQREATGLDLPLI